MVHEENQTPCQPLYSANVHELLLDISYYRRRINFEIFHAIADGLGASVFFRALVLYYLEEAHPDLKGCGGTGDPHRRENPEDDAFRRYTGQYRGEGTTSLLGNRTGKVYRFQGQRMPDRRQLVTEITVSAARIRGAAKEYHATVTAFLSALLLLSIRETMPPSVGTGSSAWRYRWISGVILPQTPCGISSPWWRCAMIPGRGAESSVRWWKRCGRYWSGS